MKNVLSTTVKALAAVLLFTVAARAPAQTVFSITDEQAGATRVFLPSDSAISMQRRPRRRDARVARCQRSDFRR